MENINIEKVIYKWFEMKYRTYDKLEHKGSIYLYYKGEKYSEILIEKKYKYIYYNWELYKEFSEIIPLETIEFEGFMNNWFGDTFNLKGFTPDSTTSTNRSTLEIPLV